MPAPLSRRALLGLALAGSASTWIGTSGAAPFVNRTGLRPGSFIWQPTLAPAGPLFVTVALREQVVHVYRAGIAIGIATYTDGAGTGWAPTGLFLVERQQRQFVSAAGERLVWMGAPLHAANLTGYPPERGCARLPAEFAELLFRENRAGFAVVIAEERSLARVIEHPCLLLSDASGEEARHLEANCGARPAGDGVSLVVSGADARAYVMRGGRVIETVPIGRRQAAGMRGTYVYALTAPAGEGGLSCWLALAVGPTRAASHLVRFDPIAPLRDLSLANRETGTRIADALRPGSMIVLTENPAGASRRTPADLVVLSNSSLPVRSSGKAAPASHRAAARRPNATRERTGRERVSHAASLHDIFRPY